MKGLANFVLGLFMLVILVTAIATAVTGPRAVDAYVDLQSRPETVTDITMRSRTTATVTNPHRQNGVLLGAGLCAIFMVIVGGAYALLLGGEKAMKQARGLLRKHGGARPAPAPQPQPMYPRIVQPHEAHEVGETRYSLPARTVATNDAETEF